MKILRLERDALIMYQACVQESILLLVHDVHTFVS